MKQVFKQSFRDAKIAEQEMTKLLRSNYKIGIMHGFILCMIFLLFIGSIIGWIYGI